ncbi:MAG TPA: effector-associated domain EAD1-containing protein [Candidatus Elarobacter sp.]|jgi:hypothetical protein
MSTWESSGCRAGAIFSEDDLAKLAAALTAAFTNDTQLNELTIRGLNKPWAVLSSPGKPLEKVRRMLDFEEDSHKVERLITQALELRPGLEPLTTIGTAILARLADDTRGPWYEPPNPHDTLFVPGRCPFISRRTLRDFARAMVTPDAMSVLVVNGAPKSGKSYSYRLFSYVRRVLENDPQRCYGLAHADLSVESPPEYEPTHLATTIALQARTEGAPAGQWDLKTIPPPGPRHARDVAEWCVGNSRLRKMVVVIVLDGFGDDNLRSDTRDMLQHLIWLVSANNSNVRLLLLNFREELIPASLPGPIQHEHVAPLTTAEITDFFTTLANHKGLRTDRAGIDEIVASVMRQANRSVANYANYNEVLNGLVKSAAGLL